MRGSYVHQSFTMIAEASLERKCASRIGRRDSRKNPVLASADETLSR
jgi:hypothetical protein